MKSPHYFIIKPYGEKHISKKKIDGFEFIVNDSIDDHNYVNRIAEVVSTPVNYNGIIEPKDLVVVHHNTFRKYRTQMGKMIESKKHIKNDLFYTENPFMVIKNGNKISIDPYIFLKQEENDNEFDTNSKHNNLGVVAVNSKKQEEIGLSKGDKVFYENFRNYEFDIFGETFVKMEVNDIIGKL